MKTTLSIFLFFSMVLVAAFRPADANRYNSALCIAKSVKCDSDTAGKSKLCRPYVWPNTQDRACLDAACSFCSNPTKAQSFPCNTRPIVALCMPNTPPMAMGDPEEMSCAYRSSSSDAIVVDTSQLSPRGGWTMTSRGPYKGLVYKKERDLGIDKPGNGVYCFPMIAKSPGSYQLTAISYTPHQTEHNDMWVRSSLGFTFWYSGKQWVEGGAGPSKWVKAYQNSAGRIADYLHTKDHDPHKFIINNVKAGKQFEICISGRSFRYEVYRVIVRKCTGNECRGFGMGNAGNLPITPRTCVGGSTTQS